MTRLLLLAVLAMGLVVTGCGSEEESTPAPPSSGEKSDLGSMMKNVSSAVDATKYVSQLSSVQGQVDNLKKMAKDKADAQLEKLMDQIGDKLATAVKKVESLKNADGSTVDNLKKELDALMPEIKKLVDQAMAKAKELGVNIPST